MLATKLELHNSLVEPLNAFFRKVAMPGHVRMPFAAARFGP